MNEQQLFWATEYVRDYIQKNAEFDQDLGTDERRKMLSYLGDIGCILSIEAS